MPKYVSYMQGYVGLINPLQLQEPSPTTVNEIHSSHRTGTPPSSAPTGNIPIFIPTKAGKSNSNCSELQRPIRLDVTALIS